MAVRNIKEGSCYKRSVAELQRRGDKKSIETLKNSEIIADFANDIFICAKMYAHVPFDDFAGRDAIKQMVKIYLIKTHGETKGVKKLIDAHIDMERETLFFALKNREAAELIAAYKKKSVRDVDDMKQDLREYEKISAAVRELLLPVQTPVNEKGKLSSAFDNIINR